MVFSHTALIRLCGRFLCDNCSFMFGIITIYEKHIDILTLIDYT